MGVAPKAIAKKLNHEGVTDVPGCTEPEHTDHQYHVGLEIKGDQRGDPQGSGRGVLTTGLIRRYAGRAGSSTPCWDALPFSARATC